MLKRFLLASLPCLALYSCGKTIVDYRATGEFHYYNRMADTIHMRIHGGQKALQDYDLAPGAEVVLSTVGETSELYTQPNGYVPAVYGDSTIIYFNDTTCYKEYGTNKGPLFNIGSYTNTKKGDRDYIFYFNIDSSLYKQAGKCK